ncbi:15511_t:CDS:2 [Funneliformis geosporum]|nr:15511_t:CDS:2 [Funneliformis geosporum]
MILPGDTSDSLTRRNRFSRCGIIQMFWSLSDVDDVGMNETFDIDNELRISQKSSSFNRSELSANCNEQPPDAKKNGKIYGVAKNVYPFLKRLSDNVTTELSLLLKDDIG